jgi:hypothetical protein
LIGVKELKKNNFKFFFKEEGKDKNNSLCNSFCLAESVDTIDPPLPPSFEVNPI